MPYSGANDPDLPDNVKGLPETQRRQWVAIWNDSFERCTGDNGADCESVAFRNANGVLFGEQMSNTHIQDLHFTVNKVAKVERRTVGGVDYLVAPVVAIKAGVLKDELVPLEEISSYVAAWNGRPFVIGHPKNSDGKEISANHPAILTTSQIGQLFNARLDDSAIKGEVWINVEKAGQVHRGREVLDRLENGKPLEVSTAYYRKRINETGALNGRPYTGIARDLHPDHLAGLLDTEGACSWQDGCGTPRVNQQEVDLRPTEEMTEEAERGLAWRREFKRGGTEIGVARARDIINRKELSIDTVDRMVSFFARHEVDKEADGFSPDEDGYPSAGRIAWALWGGDPGQAWAKRKRGQLEGAMRANVLSKARRPSFEGTETTAWDSVTKTFQAYRDGYYRHTAAERPGADEIPNRVQDAPQAMKDWIASKTLIGDPGADLESDLIAFPVVNPGTNRLNAGGLRGAISRAPQADIPESAASSIQSVGRDLLESQFKTQAANESKIVGLLKAIASKLGVNQEDKMDELVSAIMEDGRLKLSEETLRGLDESVLSAIASLLKAAEQREPEVEQEPEPAANEDCVPEALANLAGAIEQRGGIEAIFAQLDSLRANETEHRVKLIASLAANSACMFTKEQLEQLNVETLETLSRSLSPADYSGQSGGERSTTKIEPYVMPDVFAARQEVQ